MVSVHTALIDAIDDWNQLYPIRAEEYASHDAPLAPDDSKVRVLRELRLRLRVRFKGWCMEEVLMFVKCCFSREELIEVTRHGRYSTFIDEVYDMWEPEFYDWACLIWLFCGRSCELFTDIMWLFQELTDAEGRFPLPKRRDMGKVLLCDMMQRGMLHERTGANIIGALVRYPTENSLARLHANEIEQLSADLTPRQMGFVLRCVLLSRAKEECNCGYGVDEDVCQCASRYIMNNYQGPKGIVLEGDLNKEYACVICKLILESHDDTASQVSKLRAKGTAWNEKQVGEFIREVCEEVFSEEVYKELFQNLRHGAEPTLKMRHPRVLGQTERQNNVLRNADGDYNHGVAQHGGCVELGCKQAIKVGCVNMSCNTHCRSKGKRSCQPHKNYSPLAFPSYPQRKNILQ